CYKEQGKFDKAIEVLQKAVALGNIHSYNELAICYKEQGKFDKAIEVLEKATKEFPKDVKLLNELAICYKEQGKFDKAIQVLQKAIKRFPNNKYFPNTLRRVRKAAQEPRSISIFTAYAAADKDYADKIKKKMKYLVRPKKVRFLDRESVKIGGEVELSIQKYLSEAQIILLLLSDDFLDCDVLYERELKTAIKRHKANEIKVIPIKCRPCIYKGSSFEGLQSLPRTADAFIENYTTNKEQVFTDIAQKIGDFVEEMLAKK
ncbi:MAG: tetratricopeptide repeat protein, partial [Chitinophagales bacterium]